MPDRFSSQELTDTWVGLYSQPTVPPSLSKRYSTVLHNVSLIRGMPHTRPGRKRINGMLVGDGTRTVYGLAVWRDSANGDQLIIASGSLLQSLPILGGDPTNLTESYPSGFPARTGARTIFAQLGNRLFIVNGTDENVKFNGTALTRMGVVAPSSLSAPTFASGALTGQYKYVATILSSTSNGSVESEATSPLTVTYASQQGTFTAPSVPSSDPQMDRWNLYRVVQGQNTYYRVNTSPQTLATTIVDNVSDTVLQGGVLLSGSLVNSPPPGKFRLLCVHQGRLVGVPSNDPNTIYWSDLGIDLGGIFAKPESWPPSNRIQFGENGGTVITALVSFFDWLVVFQDFGTWSIKGDINGEGDREISPLLVAPDNRGIGVSDQTNIAHAENKILVASKDGLYAIQREVGSTVVDLAVRPLSNTISKLYQQIDFSHGGSSVYNRDLHHWLFWGKGKL